MPDIPYHVEKRVMKSVANGVESGGCVKQCQCNNVAIINGLRFMSLCTFKKQFLCSYLCRFKN